MTRNYDSIPLPSSAFGGEMYRVGRALVQATSIRLDQIVWDADEVLWDWTMKASRMLKPGAFRWGRDLGHREYYVVKPGIFELIWGMRHASLEEGGDGCMRIWTNGYPWRLWRIGRHIPGFGELLESPSQPPPTGRGALARHARIFYRLDFIRLVERWLDRGWPSERREWSPESRALIVEELTRDPCDSTLKIPELAAWYGKEGFGSSEYLIDDRVHTIERFVAAGRCAVLVSAPTPRIGCGRVPNTVWRRPIPTLIRLLRGVARPIAASLRRLAASSKPAWERAQSGEVPLGYPLRTFAIDVPDGALRREWLHPMRRLERRIATR